QAFHPQGPNRGFQSAFVISSSFSKLAWRNRGNRSTEHHETNSPRRIGPTRARSSPHGPNKLVVVERLESLPGRGRGQRRKTGRELKHVLQSVTGGSCFGARSPAGSAPTGLGRSRCRKR